jgi:putative phage-type endonuclease
MQLDSPAVIVTDRTQWLEARKEGIGASEAPAALGLSPFESPAELYLRKRGRLGPTEETEAMRWGLLLEPVIAEEYSRRTGHRIVGAQLFYRDPAGPLMATIDVMTETHPVEIKTVGAFGAKELGEAGTDQLPEHWLIQAHQQMILTGAPLIDFAILIGGQRLVIHTVQRNKELCQLIRDRVTDFWRDVRTGIPPASNARADRKIMHLLYPDSDGEITLDQDIAALVDEYVSEGDRAHALEDSKATRRAQILEALGNHALGRLPDGRILTRKIINMAEKTVTRKAYSYVGLWITHGLKG